MEEIWIPVEDWPYEVSNLGRVRRVTNRTCGKAGYVLKPNPTDKGYLRVTLTDGKRQKTAYVAPMVCTAFKGPKPPRHEAAHLNGWKQDNSALNLAWKTHAENEIDKRLHNRHTRGESHPLSKLRDVDVVAILALLQTDRFSKLQIAKMFGVNDSLISHIEFGRNWTHVDRTGFVPNSIKNGGG